MKPVTALYEAAEHVDLANIKTLARLDAAIDGLSKLDPTNDRVLLRVLDLVATLPPERLALVRWAAGLATADALAVLDALVDAHGRESSPAVARLRDGLMAALSGGQGGAKEEPPACTSSGCQSCGFSGGCDQDDAACDQPGECPDAGCEVCRQAEEQQPPHPMWGAVANAVAKEEPNHKDEICALETRLAEVRAKIQCGDRPSSPPVVLLREEDDLRTRLYMLRAAQHTAKPKPTILRAGTPPPFLRVGMKLWGSDGHIWKVSRLQENAVEMWNAAAGERWRRHADVAAWPLAEDFAVEGEP